MQSRHFDRNPVRFRFASSVRVRGTKESHVKVKRLRISVSHERGTAKHDAHEDVYYKHALRMLSASMSIKTGYNIGTKKKEAFFPIVARVEF